MDKSLFEMIKNTHKTTPDFTVSAYSDNAAVLEGERANYWAPDYATGSWQLTKEIVHMLAKVETHNHPTAISPFPGAATGSGGKYESLTIKDTRSGALVTSCGFLEASPLFRTSAS
jgi:phosphoribosylformylglycinamidine synthase